MNTYQKAIVALAGLPVLALAGTAGGYVYLDHRYSRPVQIASGDAVVSTPATGTPSKADASYLGSASYKGEVSDSSKIQKDEKGDLYLIAYNKTGTKFVTAVQSGTTMPAPAQGWEITKVGHDSMWLPGACAQKPSWLIGGRYVIIDDSVYDGAKNVNYYAVYDTQTKKFTDFGGALLSEQQTKEKILLANVEDEKLVFYIDQYDAKGLFANGQTGKHSRADKENYIIRRVIDVATLKYEDYRISYQQPDYDYYYTTAEGYGKTVRLFISPDGHKEFQVGEVHPGQEVAFTKMTSEERYKILSEKNTAEEAAYKPYVAKIGELANGIQGYRQAFFGADSISSPISKIDPQYIGDSGGYVDVAFYSDGPGGGIIPAVYDTKAAKLDPLVPEDSWQAWHDAFSKGYPFILGVFES